MGTQRLQYALQSMWLAAKRSDQATTAADRATANFWANQAQMWAEVAQTLRIAQEDSLTAGAQSDDLGG